MGLLKKMTNEVAPQKGPSDDALILHGMLCVAGADGAFDDAEIELVQGYFATLPEFEGKDWEEVYNGAKKVLSKYNSVFESVKALADLSTQALKNKMFVLAVDIALSSGDVDEAEDEMLEAMQRVLSIPDELAAKIIEVMAIKYAQ
ncbi:MAG TPA: tellurite resistance TerB family protein [Bacillota bacterium]|nr:tellurite resistance TerB family protein [Bacillota bacterium]HOL10480.1 tellurite resistance TerB family protein [Bacillota bacterium]HPO98233.1 tellurite resistance TerB family protein [Bacillota bacterium]